LYTKLENIKFIFFNRKMQFVRYKLKFTGTRAKDV